MRRRRQDPVMQKLRQLARAGRRTEAVNYLEEVLRESPNHEAARRELSRHLTGRPFSFEEADYDEIQSIISSFLTNPQMLTGMRRPAIKRLRQRVSYLQRAQSHALNATEQKTLQQIRRSIGRELQRRRKPLSKAGKAAIAALLVILGITASGIYLWRSAERAADELARAGKEGFQRNVAKQILSAHDTGLNRTLNRRVGEEADRLRALIKAASLRAKELDAILSVIERGEQTVVNQGVRRRALIERKLQEMGADAGSLKTRWIELCNREKDALSQQRLALAAELMSPLPESERLQHDVHADWNILSARRKILQQRINIFDDASASLQLQRDIIKPVVEEQKQVELLFQEVSALKQMLELLPAAHDYKSYKQYLQKFTPRHYAPGIRMMKVLSQLPDIENLRGKMQEHGQNLPAGLLKAAQHCLLEGGPAFTSAFPASREQLHLLDEILTNSALRTRLYELTNADHEHAYTEKLPVIRHGRACFERSTLDPEHDAAISTAMEWCDPQRIMQRVIDPRPLFNELGMQNRSSFVLNANIHKLLTQVLQTEGPEIPVLARAYLFDQLVQINELHEKPILNGLRFAPQMRRTINSFKKVKEKCGIKLDGSCWLRISHVHTAAEREFASWFHRHKTDDFAAEVRQNIGTLLRVAPRFCGYVNEAGEAVLFEKVKEEQLLWYLSGASMTTSGSSEPLQKPTLLSPVFIMEKHY